MFRVSLLFLSLVSWVLAEPNGQTVLTPYGERPVANVRAVPTGGEVRLAGDQIHLLSSVGEILHVATNDGSRVREHSTPTSDAVKPLQTGWVGYAYWTNTGSSPVSLFNTTWSVPPVPAKYDGQTLFIFPAMEPASGNSILQPVLQYGPSAAGGGAYYAVSSWYVVGSQTYYTTPVKVSVGATLSSTISLTSYSGSSYNYATSFTNISGTSLSATGSAQLVWLAESLEVYGVTSASDIPTGSTVFYPINVRTTAGTPNVTWSAVGSTQDGVGVTINKQGATNAEITITY
ncbi:hypothetical protein DL93DRAFT_2167755 [Clavulina sp. PMI_390]|nr:hypothetical protein DL93DRAFT_2167755 [Clavulina sp. PMI_390]